MQPESEQSKLNVQDVGTLQQAVEAMTAERNAALSLHTAAAAAQQASTVLFQSCSEAEQAGHTDKAAMSTSQVLVKSIHIFVFSPYTWSCSLCDTHRPQAA